MNEEPTTIKGERIAKRMARAGLCSRRDAESWIKAGRVKVNDKEIDSPALNVTPNDVITVDGTVLPDEETTRLWLYHKPAGLVTTHKDPRGRPTVFAHLPKGLPRVISVGRLDVNSEGLLLLTNNGELARYLELPATGWLRHYRARAHGVLSAQAIRELAEGVVIDRIHYGSVTVIPEATSKSANRQKTNYWYEVRLSEGKKREIRTVFEYYDCPVNRLIRTAYGPFQLGTLPRGEVKEVPRKQLKNSLPQFA